MATTVGAVASNVLLAISAGAVFMGAMTYIGNAPNFMVKSIAERSGVKMPSFFGYMGWSLAILVPLFALDTVLSVSYTHLDVYKRQPPCSRTLARQGRRCIKA